MQAFSSLSRTKSPCQKRKKLDDRMGLKGLWCLHGGSWDRLQECLHTVDTPLRVSRLWVSDIAASFYAPPPRITTFDNTRGYGDLLFRGPIPIKSICSHHHSPFVGEAYIAYIPQREGRTVGLSNLNRIAKFYSRMPQL
ncbi:GTP cyclohydrolase I [Encephalitozoon romaleae SJ-2008]|uniref:GTP cyclohydrolase I n=1 Tax=Encephalitozoon romaleae (strain SJ-2008) TaxID=1178016 RepID=I7ADV4_ENCRO|nr:GTP cyclohydrolase I [Encephalitozoon romaleae SJ-2008]AFN82775.1 GTP cyclohydrolase I [Encephalitozoon romaleae SJ-2008]